MAEADPVENKPETCGKFALAVQACVSNAARLLDDTRELCEGRRPEATYQLAILTQEECAKAFLLSLIDEGILPWTAEVERAMKNHECKHLIGIIMWWMNPSFEEVYERRKARYDGPWKPVELPDEVLDAINVLRHEKIGRWISQSWEWTEDPKWDRKVKKVAEGKIERMKQRAVYAHVGKDGSYQVPKVSLQDAEAEYNRARQMLEIVQSQCLAWFEHDAVKEAMKTVFADLQRDDKTSSSG